MDGNSTQVFISRMRTRFFERSEMFDSSRPWYVDTSDMSFRAGAGRIRLDDDGLFVVDNQGTPRPVLTAISTAATVNSESLGVGDVMIGDNSSGRANVLFDQSAGTLIMRTGTTSVLTLDPTSGLVVSAGSAFATTRAVNFFNGSTRVGELYGYATSSAHSVQIRARSTSSSLTAFAYTMALNTSSTGVSYASLYAARAVDPEADPATFTYPIADIFSTTNANTSTAESSMYATTGASDVAYIRVVSSGTTQTNTYVADNHNFTGTKSGFIIDHPLDPENKWLVHTPVESDALRVVYDGEVTLDQRGESVVTMPEWFAPLTKNVRVVLTCRDQHMPVYIADVRPRRFTIAGGQAGGRVFWMLSAERADPWAAQRPVQIERDKDDSERGTLFAWREYGAPEAKNWRRVTRDETTQPRRPDQTGRD